MVNKILRVLLCLSLFFVAQASADQYPSKVITIVVPFTAGGPTDAVARLLARSMSTALKQQVIVENVAGAGGTIGATRVAKAAPDGYTMLLHHIGHSTAPTLYRKLPYNSITDFEPIGLVADIPMTLVAKKDFPANDLKELIAYVKANSAKINLANAGVGAASHLCGMLFQTAIQTDLTTVPYGGTGPAMNDLLGGQVDLMCDQVTSTITQIKGGKIKVFGVTTKKRIPALPDVPTLHEAGLLNFEVAVWNGLYAPKGTPKAIIEKLTQALQESLRDATLRQRFADLGTEVKPESRGTPEALRTQLKAEIDKWAPIIKKAG
ncbi:MAG: tripartite tricarboxylate transporter substrate binding protein BugD, partial [Smithellaceae bacterium]|nr:tripartite tricarboxylate transporter substrate binding protein BugD [Smithellaceae bacterium]MDI6741079.1 tripartite tricarboxylate transporter substrate binding protein BugD [Candidatus Edwardsbacteria bacterium]